MASPMTTNITAANLFFIAHASNGSSESECRVCLFPIGDFVKQFVVDTSNDETNNPNKIRRFKMKRFVFSIIAIVGMFGLPGVTSVAAQGYSPQFPKKDAPKVGAWWYTGATPPPLLDGHPDLTGVWYGGSSADLSKDTIKG